MYLWLLEYCKGPNSEVPSFKHIAKLGFSTVPPWGLTPLWAGKCQQAVDLLCMHGSLYIWIIWYLCVHKAALWSGTLRTLGPNLGGCQNLNSSPQILVCYTLMLIQVCSISMVGCKCIVVSYTVLPWYGVPTDLPSNGVNICTLFCGRCEYFWNTLSMFHKFLQMEPCSVQTVYTLAL